MNSLHTLLSVCCSTTAVRHEDALAHALLISENAAPQLGCSAKERNVRIVLDQMNVTMVFTASIFIEMFTGFEFVCCRPGANCWGIHV